MLSEMRLKCRAISRTKLRRARELRREATAAEEHAWSLLRDRRLLGLKFRRQHVIGGFVVDFYCAARRLVLEIDGSIHRTVAQAEYDAARTQYLELRGLRVIRIPNEEVSEVSLKALL
jgi:very-short-patch-repair endonuclease